MDNFVFFTSLTFCCFYAFFKILNLRISKFALVMVTGFSLLLGAAMYILKNSLPSARFLIASVSMILVLSLISKKPLEELVPALFLSIIISYGFSFIATLLAFFAYEILDANGAQASLLIVAAIQITFIILLFKYPRFKKGFTFLHEKWWSNGICLMLGGFALFAVAMISTRPSSIKVGAGLVVSVSVIAVLIIMWGLVSITSTYRLRQSEKIRAEDAETIAALQKSNEALSRVNHSDNKVLPSMYLAVSEFLSEASDSLSVELQDRGNAMLGDINQVMMHRLEQLGGYDIEKLPKTDIFLIDNLLGYMLIKAAAKRVRLSAEIDSDAIQQSEVAPVKLQSMLADILENAITATAEADIRQIRLVIRSVGGVLEFKASDSGVPFDGEVLRKLGSERVSTRRDGGLGYVNVFSILREYNASLDITEHTPRTDGYTKTVTVRFDGKGEYAAPALPPGSDGREDASTIGD